MRRVELVGHDITCLLLQSDIFVMMAVWSNKQVLYSEYHGITAATASPGSSSIRLIAYERWSAV